jgi:long-chain acyl-CoA synthetase
MNNPYESRPWLKLYPPRIPGDIDIPKRTAIEVFDDTVSLKGASPAIHYFDSTITWGELDSLSSSLAVAFIDFGITKGDRIALDLQNVPQLVISQYAAWKLGAIVVPLNPMYREHELEY